MSIVLNTIKTYNVFEYQCQANQLISEVSATRDDSYEPNIKYYPYDTDDVYDYIFINNNTGEVYLTLDGVEAINTDYPENPSQEITELNFNVVAKDEDQGDQLIIPVKVSVIRDHMTKPRITSYFEYKIYLDDACENYVVADVQTEYSSNFYYTSTTDSYFTFPVINQGRLVLTASGVEYFEGINQEYKDTGELPITSISAPIKIIDEHNNKTLEFNLNFEIVPGSSLNYTEKKSILEEIAGILGIDLSYKFEKITQDVNYLKFIESITFNNDTDIQESKLVRSTYQGMSFTNLFLNGLTYENIMNSSSDVFENKLSQFIKDIISANNTNVNILNTILQDTSYNTNLQVFNDLNSQKLDLITIDSKEYYEYSEINLQKMYENTYRAVEDIIFNKKLNDALSISKNYTDDAISEVINELNNLYNGVSSLSKTAISNLYNDLKNLLMDTRDGVLAKTELFTGESWDNVHSTKYNSESNTTLYADWYNRIVDDTLDEVRDDEEENDTNYEDRYYNKKKIIKPGTPLHQIVKEFSNDLALNYSFVAKYHDYSIQDWSTNNSDYTWYFTNNELNYSTGGDGGTKYKVLHTDTSNGNLVIGDDAASNTAGDWSNTYLKSKHIIFQLSDSQDSDKYVAYFRDSNGNDTIVVDGDIFKGTAVTAQYADIAEYYLADKEYDYGTVMMIGGDNEITEYTNGVLIGVVSHKPGMILNEPKDKEQSKFSLPIALKGRVPVKIEPNTKVKKGDSLYTSTEYPGCCAQKPYAEILSSNFVGYALEDLEPSDNIEKIEVFIK